MKNDFERQKALFKLEKEEKHYKQMPANYLSDS